jgi:hypothetical protein
MKDEKIIEKIRQELVSIQNQISEDYEKREKLVEDYTRKLLNFEVVDPEANPELISKKQMTSK